MEVILEAYFQPCRHGALQHFEVVCCLLPRVRPVVQQGWGRVLRPSLSSRFALGAAFGLRGGWRVLRGLGAFLCLCSPHALQHCQDVSCCIARGTVSGGLACAELGEEMGLADASPVAGQRLGACRGRRCMPIGAGRWRSAEDMCQLVEGPLVPWLYSPAKLELEFICVDHVRTGFVPADQVVHVGDSKLQKGEPHAGGDGSSAHTQPRGVCPEVSEQLFYDGQRRYRDGSVVFENGRANILSQQYMFGQSQELGMSGGIGGAQPPQCRQLLREEGPCGYAQGPRIIKGMAEVCNALSRVVHPH